MWNMSDKGIKNAADLTKQEFWILSSLVAAPKHGYAIAKQVQEVSDGSVKLSAGTLYENIHRMLEAGLILRDDEFEIEPGVRRKRYRASGAGARILNEHFQLMQRASSLVPKLSI